MVEMRDTNTNIMMKIAIPGLPGVETAAMVKTAAS
jgi:hypothetical protein